jgi:hypothetical protein
MRVSNGLPCEYISSIDWIELKESVNMVMLASGTIYSDFTAFRIPESSAVNTEASSTSLNLLVLVSVTTALPFFFCVF